MAATVAVSQQNFVGNKRHVLVTVTPDTSYLTGGYSIKPSDIGLVTIDSADAGAGDGTTTAVVWKYNTGTQKLQAYWTGAGLSAVLAEVTNATNLSASVVRITFRGN